MKKIMLILTTLALCLCLVGPVSAFIITEDIETIPSGGLASGDRINVSIQVMFPKDSVREGESFYLTTVLDNPEWTTFIHQGGQGGSEKININKKYVIDNFLLRYDGDVYVNINLTGTVPSIFSGSKISVMNLEHIKHIKNDDTLLDNYSAPEQYVYSQQSLNAAIMKLGNTISYLESAESAYSSKGADTKEAKVIIKSAKSLYLVSDAHKTNDMRKSIEALERAQVLADEADRKLDYIGIGLISSITSQVREVVNDLNSLGIPEAGLVSASNMAIIQSYNMIVTSYNAGGNPDVYAVLKEADNVLNMANSYKYANPTSTPEITPTSSSSQNPIITPTSNPKVSPTGNPIVGPNTGSIPDAPADKEDKMLIKILLVVIGVLIVVLVVNTIVLKSASKDKRRRRKDKDEL